MGAAPVQIVRSPLRYDGGDCTIAETVFAKTGFIGHVRGMQVPVFQVCLAHKPSPTAAQSERLELCSTHASKKPNNVSLLPPRLHDIANLLCQQHR